MNTTITNTISINKTQYNLQDLEALAWKKLLNGSVKKKNGFRTMCLGTISLDANSSLRIVVNRKVEELNKKIYFHTDIRSRKFFELQKDKRITLLFYDARQRIQIMVKAYANIHIDDALSNERWKATSPQARLGYMTLDAPNTKSNFPTLGYDERFSAEKPTEAESAIYKKNFAVIACQVYELEFLYLDYQGNRKANFYYREGLLQESYWVVP